MIQFKVEPALDRKAPSVVIGAEGAKSLHLGRLSELGRTRDVILGMDKEHVVALVGKRGSGKTHTLGVVLEELAKPRDPAGGERRQAVLLLDTLNLFQWIGLPLAEAKGPNADEQRGLMSKWRLEARQIEPRFWHPVGCEPQGVDSQEFAVRPEEMEAQDWGRLLGMDIVREPMGQLLSDAHDKVVRSGWTRKGISEPAKTDYSILDLVACLNDDPSLGSDYTPETIRAVRQRLGAYEKSGLFAADGPRLTDLLSSGTGVVSILLLARAPEDIRSAITFLVIRRLLEERARASERAKTAVIAGENPAEDDVPPTWLLIDEAQNVIPSVASTAANDILTRFVREGRNHGLSMAISTQQPSAIDARIMAQVDVLVSHTLTARADVNYILANLKSGEPSKIWRGGQSVSLSDSVRLLDTGQCLVSSTDVSRAFFMQVRPRLTIHGGFEA